MKIESCSRLAICRASAVSLSKFPRVQLRGIAVCAVLLPTQQLQQPNSRGEQNNTEQKEAPTDQNTRNRRGDKLGSKHKTANPHQSLQDPLSQKRSMTSDEFKLDWQWTHLSASSINAVLPKSSTRFNKSISLVVEDNFPGKEKDHLDRLFHPALKALKIHFRTSVSWQNNDFWEALLSSTTLHFIHLESYRQEKCLLKWEMFIFRTSLAERLRTLVVYSGHFEVPQMKRFCRAFRHNQTLRNLLIRGSTLPETDLAYHFFCDLEHCSFDWSIASSDQLKIFAHRIRKQEVKAMYFKFSAPSQDSESYLSAKRYMFGVLEKCSKISFCMNLPSGTSLSYFQLAAGVCYDKQISF